MLEEQDYKWQTPGTFFNYTGCPIPVLEKKGLSSFPANKEDQCYIGEWMKELRCAFYYGYRNGGSWPQVTSDYWKAQVVRNYELNDLLSYQKYFFCLSCGTGSYDAQTGTLCTFDLGGKTWEDFWEPFSSQWHHKYKSQYDYNVHTYGFDVVPPLSSRERALSVSDILNPAHGYLAGITSLTQNAFSDVLVTWKKEPLEAMYYNMNRLSNEGWCTTDLQYTDGTIIDHSIKGDIWYYKPWQGSYSNNAVRGPLADDTYNWRHIDKYVSGDYISSEVKQLTCDYSGTYIPKGQPSHAIFNSITWTNTEMWQQVTSYKKQQQITWFENGGNPHFLVCPMLKGKIKKLGVWMVMFAESVRWTASGSYPYDYYYFYKFFPLTKVDDHEGYETWEDTSGYWLDSRNMQNTMLDGIMSMSGRGKPYYFYGSRTNIGAFFCQLDTGELKFWFDYVRDPSA